MATGPVSLNPRQQSDGVWLLDYRSGKLLGTVHAYPTLAETLKSAAGEWRRAHQPERLLRLVERYHRWRRR